MKKYMGITLAVLLMVLVVLSTGCEKSQASGASAADENKVMIVGLDDTFVPMGYRDEAGNVVGFDVDLANEVGNRIGMEVKFQPIDWAMKETELDSGNIDMIWNGYTITKARQEKVTFSNPYLKNSQIIITLAGADIKVKQDLSDSVVATQAGSSSLEAINKEPELLMSFKDGDVILFDTYNEAFMDLEAGRVDAIVADGVMSRYLISKRGEDKYFILTENFGDEEYGVGFRKNDEEFYPLVNEALEAMKEDGTYKEITTKWFGEKLTY